MKIWSDNPLHESFVLNIFCDTNILVYLIDITFPSLNKLIHILGEIPFTQLVSSKYVIFEFIGVRKREHYLRIAATKSPKDAKGKVNFSSLIKYVDQYSSPHTEFAEIIPEIKLVIDEEINKLFEEFKINYEYSHFHKDQILPTFDVCLTTKIDSQDSLVLISSVLPEEKQPQDKFWLLTNDTNFVTRFDEADFTGIVTKHGITFPFLPRFKDFKFQVNGKGINLEIEQTDEDLTTFLKQQIISSLIEKLKNLFFGTTFKLTNPIPSDIVCLKLAKGFTVMNGVYLTIIGKDLDFIYTTKKRVDRFEENNVEVPNNKTFPLDTTSRISFKIMDVDEEGHEKPIEPDILESLTAEGNLIFIHPDS